MSKTTTITIPCELLRSLVAHLNATRRMMLEARSGDQPSEAAHAALAETFLEADAALRDAGPMPDWACRT